MISEGITVLREESDSKTDTNLSRNDLRRINNNVELLKNKNIPFFDCQINPPSDEKTVLKSKEEVINKMITTYTMSILSTYILDNASILVNAAYKKLDEKFNVSELLSAEEKDIVEKIITNKYTKKELEDISNKLEQVRVFMWALDLIEDIEVDKECNIKEINRVFFMMNRREIDGNTFLKSKEELLLFLDLLLRFQGISEEMAKNNKIMKGLNNLVVDEQVKALSWMTTYNKNNKYMLVKCDRNTLKFKLRIPEYLKIENTSGNDKELFSLVSEDSKSKMIMFDLGECNSDNYEDRVESIIESYNNIGFSVVNKYALSSDNLGVKIHQIVIERSNIAINSYILLVSNHIIRFDSLIEKNTDYKDYNNLINSSNSNIDLDILFSIREIEIEDDFDDGVYHEFDYSNMIPTGSNVGEIIKYIEEVYNRINNIDDHNYELDYKIKIDGLFSDNIKCNNYEEYKSRVENGSINKIDSIEINLVINRKENDKNYNNRFVITIRPYDIRFERISNKNETNMNEIEHSINNILKKLPTSNTVFYSK